jgi:NADPH-dependent curcumin reductase CurA
MTAHAYRPGCSNFTADGLKNYMAIVRSQLLYQGFIVSRWADEFDEARAQLAEWMAEGKIVHGTSLFSLSHT